MVTHVVEASRTQERTETSAPTSVAAQSVLHTTKDGAILLESTHISGQNKNKQQSLPRTNTGEEANLTQLSTDERSFEMSGQTIRSAS